MDGCQKTRHDHSFSGHHGSQHGEGLQEKSAGDVLENECVQNLSKFQVYCMSDSLGHLHFSLSIYPESNLDPSEQQKLGRQLPEYIREHFDGYWKNKPVPVCGDTSKIGSGHSSSFLQSLYDDFIAQHPTFSLSYQTYIRALNHLPALAREVFSIPAMKQGNNISNRTTSLADSYLPSRLNSNYNSHATGSSVDGVTSRIESGRGHNISDHAKQTASFNLADGDGSTNSRRDLTSDHAGSSAGPTDEFCSSLQQESPHFADPSSLIALRKHKTRPLAPICSCPANNCASVFPERERQKLCKRFWSGKNAKGNLLWVGASVQGHFPPYKFRSKSHLQSFNTHSFFIGKFFLHKPTSGRKEVCKCFFLTTLGLRFFFPLYDMLRQSHHPSNQTKSRRSLPSNKKPYSWKKNAKRKTFLKHVMRRHVLKYFIGRCFQKMQPSSSSLSTSSMLHAKRSFRHFASLYPHMLDKKSIQKYLAIVCKIVNAKRLKANSSSLSSTTKTISNKSQEYSSREIFTSDKTVNSIGHSSDDRVMKIKPEDFDEVIADDMQKKLTTIVGDSCVAGQLCGSEDQQRNSQSFEESNGQVTLDEDAISSNKTVINSDANISVDQTISKTFGSKCNKRSGKTKLKKAGSHARKNKTSEKVSSRKRYVPEKVYKIAVNEIEDDQSKHPILPACNCHKSNCGTKVREDQRHLIHSEFWNLDIISRRAWMVKHVQVLKPKSRSNRATARLHKMHRKFFLPDSSGQLHDVCKKFFLATLGFKGVGVLRPQRIPDVKVSPPQKEPRKRVLSYQVCQQDVVSVIQYCNLFNREKNVGFHGDERLSILSKDSLCSESNPNQKISVPYGFSWKELYRDYCAKHHGVEFGYQTFRSILSLVEHNNFCEALLDKFQSLTNSSRDESSPCESQQQNADSELSPNSYDEEFHLLQSFPAIHKTPKKVVALKMKRTIVDVPQKRRAKNKLPRLHKKKLKLSKTFLAQELPDISDISCTSRNTRSSRYNFRQGVQNVSYAIYTDAAIQNDDLFRDDLVLEDIGFDDIKEEVHSDQEEESRKVTKKTGKKRGRPPGKKNKKPKCARVSPDKNYAPDESDVPIEPYEYYDEDADSDGKDASFEKPLPRGKTDGSKRGRKRKSAKYWMMKFLEKNQETTTRLKHRHPILPPCKCNYRKCHEKIPQMQREVIHSLYWSLSTKQDRGKWVLEHIQRGSPKTRSNTGVRSRKREARRYFLSNETDESVEVCRVFFLRTLGYQWDSVVDTVSRATPRPDGQLAKSLGCSEEQLPYEVVSQVRKYLKRKKIKKSSIDASQFPDNFSDDDENESVSDRNGFTLGGYPIKELFKEFVTLHPDHIFDSQTFKRLVRFILVPNSEGLSEKEIKQEQLQNPFGEGPPDVPDYVNHKGVLQDVSTAEEEASNLVYFTPEFEKIDIEKALNRKAKRRRPVSSRNSKEQHPIREPCQCVRKCLDKIEQQRREEIHQEYWDLITYNQRKQWILEHIKREAPKRRTNLSRPLKKMETRKFYLRDWTGEKIEICKNFFLSTLGFKWDKMVDTICKTTPRNGQYVRPDQRGKKPPSHKLSETLISSVTKYVESILETASCVYPKPPPPPPRANVNKQQKNKCMDRMPYGLTMKNLFEDYKIKHLNHKVGYESFRKIYRTVVQSDKFSQATSSPDHHDQAHDEDDDDDDNNEPLTDHLSQSPQHTTTLTTNSVSSVTNLGRLSADRPGGEQDAPLSFETAHQSCMYKSQAGLRLHSNSDHPLHNVPTANQVHLPASFQRQCEQSSAAAMKAFPEGLNSSFPKPHHDVPFFTAQGIDQNEEMSMQMYKSICLPPANPNQSYPFYPNNFPLDAFSMTPGPQGLHGGLPYSADSLRHSDLMHPHHHHHHHHPAYQPAHHHFGHPRFHGFVLPGSAAAKQAADLSHHQHTEMNVGHNYRNDFDCNLYPGKIPLMYPSAYHNSDSLPSTSAQRHSSFNNVNIAMQAHGMHDIRVRDSPASNADDAAAAVTAANMIINDSSSSNCHVASSVSGSSVNVPSVSDWHAHLTSPTAIKEPARLGENLEVSVGRVKKSKGRPSKRVPKEKTPKIKREKKVRPKSTRNSREHNPLLPPCGCTVKKCLEKIPETRREEIYNEFWDLGIYNVRKQWIAELIVREDPKRRTSLDNPLRRMETRRFFLRNTEGEKMEVCKGFFLRTLGFKWDKMVDTICKTTEKGQTTVRPDMRGKKGPSHKLNTEVATSVENYVRAIVLAAKPAYEAGQHQAEEKEHRNQPDRDIFVPYGLTMKNFHDDYKGKHSHHKVGYESFRKIFRRVSKEVLESASLSQEEEEELRGEDVVPPILSLGKQGTDVVNPVTGLRQQASS